MNEEALNQSIRKFLKTVGVNSQHEIEKAVRAAVAAGRAKGVESFAATMRLRVAGIDLDVEFDGDIKLE
ncbi:MAG: DUF6494 family protein [Casimicrobiaceae bacterium]